MDKSVRKILVLGGGLMGSSAAWQLALRGEEITLIEQQNETYDYGSSFGEARICRSLGPKDDIFSYLHNRAVVETEHLVEFLNQEGSTRHKMEDIYTTSPVSYLFHIEKKQLIERVLRLQPDTYDLVDSPSDASTLFDLALPETDLLVREYKQHSGTINPKALIGKLHEGIRRCSGSIRYGHKVERIRKKGNSYEVFVKNDQTGIVETVEAQQVISSLGPYTPSVLKGIAPDMAKSIEPKGVFLSFLTIKKTHFETYSAEQKQKIQSFFPYIDMAGDHLFSMIEQTENGIPLLKVGGHYRRHNIDNLSAFWETEVPQDEIAWSKSSLANYFEVLNLPLDEDQLIYKKGYACVYSLTKSEVPIVDYLHLQDGIDPDFVVMGGFSGVGAKGSMAYGLIAADLLLGNPQENELYHKVREKLKFTH